MDVAQPQKKRKREKPNKKWTKEEVLKILDYLHEEGDFEMPTAQFFYKNLLHKTGIQASWDLVRWKVRNLRLSFNKANDWRKSTGAGLLESDEGVTTVEKKILKICPHYDRLNDIFGERPGPENSIKICDTGEVIETEDNFSLLFNDTVLYNSLSSPPEQSQNQTETDAIVELIQKSREDSTSSSALPGQQIVTKSAPANEAPKAVKQFADKIKKFAPKSAIDQLSAIQSERTEVQKRRIDLEKEKIDKELNLQERKLQFEQQKFKAEQEWKKQEFELKQLEIEKDERIKKLELERSERIAMYEIEMKYKCKT